jgi:uncharacterized protein (TIGR01619 family)
MSAMTEDWDFYSCRVDDELASIYLNLALIKDAPRADQPCLVWNRVQLNQPRDDGLPDNEEFDRLVAIEDALEKAVKDLPGVTYAGRNTSGGCRDFFFYAGAAVPLELAIAQSMSAFPDYEFEIGGRDDPEWSVYCEFLYPNRRQHQMIQTNKVLAHLKESGDRREIPRETKHWIYFDLPEHRAEYLAAASDSGYALGEQHDDDQSESKSEAYALTVTHVGPMDHASINNAVLELFDLAEEMSGHYSGWETSVEEGDN